MQFKTARVFQYKNSSFSIDIQHPMEKIKHIPQVHSITFYCFSRFLLSTTPFSSSQMCAQLRHLSVLCLCVCVLPVCPNAF